MIAFLLQQLVNALTIGAIYALIALGYTMVYGTLKLINFAHGELFAGGAYIAVFAAAALYIGHERIATPAEVAIIFVISFMAIGMLGVLIERVAYKPLRHAPRLAPLLSALGVAIVLQQGIIVVAGPQPFRFPELMERSQMEMGPVGFSNVNIVVLVVALALMAGLTLFIQKTTLGLRIRAVAESLPTARLLGIRVELPILIVFFVGPALGAVAGILYGMTYGIVQVGMGLTVGLKAFTAAILGGIGSIPGAVLGGFLLGLLETFGAGLLPVLTNDAIGSEFRDIFAFGILVVVLLFRPGGLLGQPYSEEHQVYKKDF